MSALSLGLRWLTVTVTVAVWGCSVEGTDVATTFGSGPMDPGGSATGSTAASSGDPTAGGETDPPPATTTEPDPTTGPGTTDDTTEESDSSGSPPADEQPQTGMYSECARLTDCIGQTNCVLVLGAESGFCSVNGCTDPVADCDLNPGASSTAAPACVMDTSGNTVCALQCAGGLTCPGGMECRELVGTEVCV